jgi:hypothetical protein
MEKSICEIHNTPLEEIEVPVLYGLPAPDQASEVKEDLFPNAHSYALGGCMFPDDPEPPYRRQVCLECRKAEKEWREIHDPPIPARAELANLFAVAYQKSKDDVS